MTWIDRFNQAIAYAEQHLCEELNPEEISRIMACPYSIFQRSFIRVTGISFTEYVRRRRLSCAAYDLRNSNASILEIGMKYGYESADAFRVAFKRMHGITPKKARKSGSSLKFYSCLHFTLMIKGVVEMDYQVVEKDGFQVIGRRRTTPSGGGTWGIAKKDGSVEQMMALGTGEPFLGLCFGFAEDGSNDYMVGIAYEGEALPGLEHYLYPPSSWLIFRAQGEIRENVLGKLWERIYGEFLLQSDYTQAELPTMERYVEWDEMTGCCKMEVWIPITSKKI